MKVSIILGTRPEIIKFSPIIREFTRTGQSFFIIHTGQHYSYRMDKVFFEQLQLRKAEYNLGVGSGTHAEQTGKMLPKIEEILLKEKPEVVLIEGDTNTVLAGALAAAKLGIKIGHVEAGLRSYDRQMPEEINRIVADHCSDLLFAPTQKSRDILLSEGIPEERIKVTGNTIVDAVCQNLKIARKKGNSPQDLGLEPHNYFLATLHRQENVDNKDRFQGILKGLEKIHKEFGSPILYPIHPRARKRLMEFKLRTKGITITTPLDYLSFLNVERNAKLVLTDSGGVQEETCILGVPCVTLRHNTERPETIEVGSNVLGGTDPNIIVRKVGFMLSKGKHWKNPFGNGEAAAKIVRILRRSLGSECN
jgi:UDP-N-acetylglucosamine 2-epimerase (non-hydrolysing)